MAGGPQPKYKTPDELKRAIDNYFENPSTHQLVYKNDTYVVPDVTMEAVAHGLGFMTRQALYNIESDKGEEFAEVIEYIRERARRYWQLHGQHGNAAFAQFMLVNLGYSNKQEVHNTNVEMTHEEWLESLR